MSAIVPAYGPIRQLDKRVEPDEQITEDQAGDVSRLARLLTRILRDVAELKRRWFPRRIDYEGIVSTGSSGAPQTKQFAHGFGGQVRWWVIDCDGVGSVTLPLVMRTNTDDKNTLTLAFYFPGNFAIRVEEAG